ncbi:hypothetical protein IMCC3317_13070 [Kordia antarctica]|uniref:Peptidase C14 caspase domain-containing protein n=1 Tax=Kordia antarctica TaxID=1218801 RepID=A0A7L4ZHQ2_9FLAO|nr:caspase family protein [Kordia antarctica]QHI35959.1 hypothetical protein IMCC3317_13070 [Kordia antarctica]
MSRKALIIGINSYNFMDSLGGCVNDANNVKDVLEYHADEKKERNFFVESITSETHRCIDREYLMDEIRELFREKRDVSLLYFAGHGHVENRQGYLVTSECERGDQGILMASILKMANNSPASNRIVILDCCFAGNFDQDFFEENLTRIAEGVTILTASTESQFSEEVNENGVFTTLFCHALKGGAASILGEVTIGNVYGYIDKAMGEYGQRPMFTTKVKRYFCLRKITSQLNVNELRKITKLFKYPDMIFKLNKTYEYTNNKEAIPKHVEEFKVLQLFNRVNLVVPDGARDMYWAAQNKKGCKLTPLGESYWEMVHREVI